MSGASGGPPPGRPPAVRQFSLRSLTSRPSAFPTVELPSVPQGQVNANELIANLRTVARSDLLVRNQAADMICDLSRHDVASRRSRIEVSRITFH